MPVVFSQWHAGIIEHKVFLVPDVPSRHAMPILQAKPTLTPGAVYSFNLLRDSILEMSSPDGNALSISYFYAEIFILTPAHRLVNV